MLRFGVAFGLAVVIGGPTAAFAQAPGQGPPMPMAIDLAKVPAGSYADYNMLMGQLPPMKMRMALVTKSPATNVIETSVEGGMMAMAGKMVMHMELAPGADATLKKVVMQLGSGDPMEMPIEMSGNKPFTKPNPKSLVGSETIKTASGSYKTKHYREKTPQGDKIDFWVSESVPPLGIVKIEVDQKNNPQIKGKLVFELTGMGKDQTAVVTKPAKPFDQAKLMQQMMGGAAAGGAGAGKSPPAPPPPPPPAKK
ncbi:MAG TPA: hypothetical protein VKQ32_16750 [Polyangia bacterium]|nr:hypothetical protein [Polyangia bacterium]